MASAAGEKYQQSVFYVRDANSGYLLLVDIGTQVSMIPPKTNMVTKVTSSNLQAANGS